MTASKIKIKKVCEWCGQEFLALKVSTRFCSKQCNGHAYKDANRKKVLLETERETLEKVSQNNISQGFNREFMSVAEAATLLGVTRMTIYNLIYNNVLHASKITSRLTFVSRSDIDAMISGADYKKKVKSERKPITEFYTTNEIKEKYGVSEGWIFKVGKEKDIPKIFHHGKTYWSKQHVEKHFAKHTENNGIVEWYSVPEMMEKFNMTTSAVYCFVSKFDIPKKKVKREVFFFKTTRRCCQEHQKRAKRRVLYNEGGYSPLWYDCRPNLQVCKESQCYNAHGGSHRINEQEGVGCSSGTSNNMIIPNYYMIISC